MFLPRDVSERFVFPTAACCKDGLKSRTHIFSTFASLAQAGMLRTDSPPATSPATLNTIGTRADLPTASHRQHPEQLKDELAVDFSQRRLNKLRAQGVCRWMLTEKCLAVGFGVQGWASEDEISSLVGHFMFRALVRTELLATFSAAYSFSQRGGRQRRRILVPVIRSRLVGAVVLRGFVVRRFSMGWCGSCRLGTSYGGKRNGPL